MKYIKRFNEELSIDLVPVIYEKIIKDNDVKYLFNCEGLSWSVIFDYSEKSKHWSRNYDADKKHYVESGIDDYEFIQVSKNPLKIASAVTYITNEFIKEYSPNCLKIFHINMKDENCKIGNMNKRSKINYLYLSKHIVGYEFTYYSLTPFSRLDEESTKSSATIALICKEGETNEHNQHFISDKNYKKVNI